MCLVIQFSTLYVKDTKFYHLVFNGVILKYQNAPNYAIYLQYYKCILVQQSYQYKKNNPENSILRCEEFRMRTFCFVFSYQNYSTLFDVVVVVVNFSQFHHLLQNSGPISAKLGTKHYWVKMIQVCENEGPCSRSRGDNQGLL